MIGSVADFNIQIGSGIYRLKDLYGKTIYAAKPLRWYKSYLSANPSGKHLTGEAVGIFRGYVANGYKGARQPYIIVGDNTQNTHVVPYAAANFSESKIKQQGGKTAGEVVTKDELEGQPWYIKFTKTALPFLVIGLVGYGYLKNKK
jgi:hypothetical protein